jgi:hypothetical protein
LTAQPQLRFDHSRVTNNNTGFDLPHPLSQWLLLALPQHHTSERREERRLDTKRATRLHPMPRQSNQQTQMEMTLNASGTKTQAAVQTPTEAIKGPSKEARLLVIATETRTDSAAESEKGTGTETEGAAETEIATETGQKRAVESEKGIETENGAERDTESGAERETESGAKRATESGAETETESGAESETETAAERGPESEAETGAGIAAETGTEIETGTENAVQTRTVMITITALNRSYCSCRVLRDLAHSRRLLRSLECPACSQQSKRCLGIVAEM